MSLKMNITKNASRAFFFGSIGILGAIAVSVPAQTMAMEMPANTICGTCGLQKPVLNWSYLAFSAARRCQDCKAILPENYKIPAETQATPTAESV